MTKCDRCLEVKEVGEFPDTPFMRQRFKVCYACMGDHFAEVKKIREDLKRKVILENKSEFDHCDLCDSNRPGVATVLSRGDQALPYEYCLCDSCVDVIESEYNVGWV